MFTMRIFTRVLCTVLCVVWLAAAGCAASYSYWQLAIFPDGHQVGPTRVANLNSEAPPSKVHPLAVTPIAVAGATEYRLLRIPSEAPAAPAVQVDTPGHDTLYYWLVGHTGLFRSPIVGPAVARQCNARKPKNVISWQKSPLYERYTVLRTDSAQVPSGLVNVLVAWGIDGTSCTDSNTGTLADYPCFPAGNTEFNAPVGSGTFLVGVSKGEAVNDSGDLQPINLAPASSREQQGNVVTAKNPSRQGALFLNISNDQYGAYDWGGPVGLYIDQSDIAGGHNDYWMGGGGPLSKSTHVPFWIWQHSYTAGQVANQIVYSEKMGKGDNVVLNLHNSTEGLIEDGGDEGTELFMASATRNLKVYDYQLAADVPAQGTLLPSTAGVNPTGTGRVVVNLSQAVKDGVVSRVDDDMKIDPTLGERYQWNRVTRLTGEGTHWTSAMLGWYISLDCDTRADGIRQWYRVMRVNSPTSLDIYAYTFFSTSTYLGHAANVVYHGLAYRGAYKFEPRATPDPQRAANGRDSYMLAPATTVVDNSLIDGKLHVMPLKQAWKKNEKFQVIAGPQNNISVGKFGIEGNVLPQDFVSGLWIYNWTDRLSNDPGLYLQGGWSKGLVVDLDGRGLSSGVVVNGSANPSGAAYLAPSDTNGLRFDKVPVVLSGRSQSGEVAFTRDRHDGATILSIGKDQLSVGDGVALKGNSLLRGRAVFSGNGTTVAYTIKFPHAYPEAPYLVASPNLPIGMGVTAVKADSATVLFATPPAAGKENIVVTWMVME